MYLADLMGVLRRRWYVLMAGLIATAGLAFAVTLVVPTEYEATASVVLLPPKLTVGSGGNPYLSLGGLQATTDVVATAMGAEDTVDAIQADGGTDDFVIERDRTTTGPILSIIATADSPEGAMKTLRLLIDQVPTTLKELQETDNVNRSFRITSAEVAQDATPSTNRKSQIRALVLMVGLGLAGTVTLAAVVDSALIRRRLPSNRAEDPMASADSRADRVAAHDPQRPDLGDANLRW